MHTCPNLTFSKLQITLTLAGFAPLGFILRDTIDGIMWRAMQGAVLVTLKKASNLPAADHNGLSDPYVRMELDDHKRTSTTHRRCLNAQWNEKFEWLYVRPQSILHAHCKDILEAFTRARMKRQWKAEQWAKSTRTFIARQAPAHALLLFRCFLICPALCQGCSASYITRAIYVLSL